MTARRGIVAPARAVGLAICQNVCPQAVVLKYWPLSCCGSAKETLTLPSVAPDMGPDWLGGQSASEAR